jgi:hypothetical protein
LSAEQAGASLKKAAPNGMPRQAEKRKWAIVIKGRWAQGTARPDRTHEERVRRLCAFCFCKRATFSDSSRSISKIHFYEDRL